MNRVIRFRGWDEDSQTMYYSDKEYEDCIFGFEKGVVVVWLREIVPQTLDEPAYERGKSVKKIMQFIGLKDKNGKEIFEGDICKNGDYENDAYAYNYRIEEVVFDKDSAAFQGWNYNEDGMTCEVIGNIYENPELIEGKEP